MSSEMGESHCLHFARGEFEKRGTPQLEDRIGPDRTVSGTLEKWNKGKISFHTTQNKTSYYDDVSS